MQYAGMAFQLGLTLAVGVFIGTKLDSYLETKKPYMTALFAILFLFAGLYVVLKDLIINKNED